MKATIESRVEKHGRQLLDIFLHAMEQNPVKLCSKLRRIEAQALQISLRICNGPEYEPSQLEKATEMIKRKLDSLLRYKVAGIPVIVNRDPRGYQLKIDDEWMATHRASLHRDMGGYGIIAPDLSDV